MFLDSIPSPEKQLNPNDTFTFSCHDDLSCFKSCCGNKHLLLTPYDVLRLKDALNLHSDGFLSGYTVYRLNPDTGFPIISLKMGDDPQKLCPFVGQTGCRVYDNRPTACRLYPLGRASSMGPDGVTREETFFRLETPSCMGVKQEKVRRVDKWRDEQGLHSYLEMNDRMLDILFHPRRIRTKPLNEGQVRKVMVACYNLDLFLEFIFESGFLLLREIDKEIRLKIEGDDKALLILGFDYLCQTLFPGR